MVNNPTDVLSVLSQISVRKKIIEFMIVLYIIFTYIGLGVIFSVPFLSKWIHSLDEATHDSGLAFKLIILPGCIVFWPVLLKKYWQSKSRQA
jgi:hypothetical protein